MSDMLGRHMNKIGLWYIHMNEPEYLEASLMTQAKHVDAIAVLDCTPPELISQIGIKRMILNACEYVKLSFEHTLRHGAGFNNEYGISTFNEVDARNHAISMLMDMKVDILVQCDADEWYSPAFFEMLRKMRVPAGVSLPELKWFSMDRYRKSAFHVRAVYASLGPKMSYNENWIKSCLANPNANKSLHCPLIHDGSVMTINDLWHNHMHDCVGPKRAMILPQNLSKYEHNENMLDNGKWPPAYLELRRKSFKNTMANSGWEKIKTQKSAAYYILGMDTEGYLPPDSDMLEQLIPKAGNIRVLDMCCGVGRNTIWIHENRACEVWGYDLENMITLAEEYTRNIIGSDHEIKYVSNLDDLKNIQFDIVICTLSLQHVLPEYLDVYYPMIARSLLESRLGLFFVHGRDWSDHNDNEIVWDRLQIYFELEKHSLSNGFADAEFKHKPPNDHHMAVFKVRKFHLMVGVYADKSNERTDELRYCINKNINNHFITIHAFLEDDSNFCNDIKKLGIKTIIINKRIMFQTMLDYANSVLYNKNVIMANLDIYFDNTLELLIPHCSSNRLFCLTRWDDGKNLGNSSSQDAWIFRSPIKSFNCSWELGKRACDNRLAYEAMIKGITILNPSLDIKANHLHKTNIRHYTSDDDIKGNCTSVEIIGIQDIPKRPM